MKYLDKLGEWIEKAQGLKHGWSSLKTILGAKRFNIRGNQGDFHIIRDSAGYRRYFGSRLRSAAGKKDEEYGSADNAKQGKKISRKMYRKLGLSTKSLEKSTNGFHAKPGRKVKAKHFTVRGKIKQGCKDGKRGVFVPADSTRN